MIKAVVFDIGGVLAQDVWEHLLLNSKADSKRGIASIFHLSHTEVEEVGHKLWQKYECMRLGPGQKWEDLERDYWEDFLQAFEGELPTSITTSDLIKMTDEFICDVATSGMVSVFERLRSKGIILAICSNNTEFWYNRQAAKLGFRNYFSEDHIFLSCRTGYAKRSPEMFKAVVGGLGIRGDECIFVEDRPENIKRAYDWFNMTGILFPPEAVWGAGYVDALLRQMNL